MEQNMEYKRLTTKHMDDMLKLDERFESRWSPGTYTDRITKFPDLAYGAFENGKLIGFVVGKKDCFGNTTISRVVVNKEYEGRGIGGRLVDIITKKIHEESDYMRSTVREGNKRSLKLHTHHGFKELHGYHMYSDGKIGIRFIKRL